MRYKLPFLKIIAAALFFPQACKLASCVGRTLTRQNQWVESKSTRCGRMRLPIGRAGNTVRRLSVVNG